MIEEEGVGGVSRMRPTSSHRLSLPVTVRHSLVVTSAMYVAMVWRTRLRTYQERFPFMMSVPEARGSGNKDM